MNPVKVLVSGTLVAFLVLSLLAVVAFAQNAHVTGTLTGVVIPASAATRATSARVRIGNTDLVVKTDAMGRFTISSAPVDGG
jgi:hypothetical protein